MLDGWSCKYSSTPHSIRPYFHVRDELVIQNGIVFKGERAVIQLALFWDIKKQIHSSHVVLRDVSEELVKLCICYPPLNNRDYTETINIV